MAGEEERERLLDDFQQDSVDLVPPRAHVQELYESRSVLGRHSPYRDRGNINLTQTSPRTKAELDHIVAIFVVAFDTKAGNVVEWCLPEDVDLEGVEFKAMTSGSHTLLNDFVYFRKGNLYGLACFENMPVESEIERGARMKSVGILSTSYTQLYRHMQFLETQVRLLLEETFDRTGTGPVSSLVDSSRHQLETPGRYDQLSAFWQDKQATLLPSSESGHLTAGSNGSTPTDSMLPEMKITHPAGCFSQFIKFFQTQIFTLWKFALLGKRILFFSPPPIGVVCYRVYCACCVSLHNFHGALASQEAKPHFYVNVADIDSLETELSYIACTTEKIFETKTQLYDVYVDNQNVLSHIPALRELLKPSDADKEKLVKLNNHRSQEMFARDGGEEYMEEEDIFTAFFMEQNNRLFQTLLDVAASADRQLTSDHMKTMGLDPTGDRSFLMELVETYGIDVILMVDNPCCPR